MRQRRHGIQQTTRHVCWGRGRKEGERERTGSGCGCRHGDMLMSLSQSEANRTVPSHPSRPVRMRCRVWQLALKTPSVECRPRSRCRSRIGLAWLLECLVMRDRPVPRPSTSSPSSPPSSQLLSLPCWIQIWCAARTAHVLPACRFPTNHPIFLAGCGPTAAFVYVVCPMFHVFRLVLSTSPHFPYGSMSALPCSPSLTKV